jgi:hypothetical protein
MVRLGISIPELMVCQYCRKKIGTVRRLKDPSFCCDDHRKKLTSKSARAVREAEEVYGADSLWTSTVRITDAKPAVKGSGRPGQATTIFALLAIAFLLLAVSDLPVGSSAPAAPGNSGPRTKGGIGQMFGEVLRSRTGATLREDFNGGVANWQGLSASAWATENGSVRPSSLRIWNKSDSLSNYEFEFMGQIDRKSMDWAFRAADFHNYYASKLIISKPGAIPNAGLVRFVVLDGRERERVELPLPLTLERGSDYRVRLSVHGNRFLTSVNGQLVSSWTDTRLSRGGVGFFSEDGESSLVKWASISERDSLLGRLVSHFTLISFPYASASMTGLR